MAEPKDDLLSPKNNRLRQLNTLIALSNKFGDSLANAFANNVAEGKRLDDVLKGVRKSLLEMTLRTALAPLQLALSQSVQGLMTGALGGSVPLHHFGLEEAAQAQAAVEQGAVGKVLIDVAEEG